MATRLLMIGIDGADAQLVDELVAAGRMPALGQLRSAGLRGKLAPLPGLADDASWTTFATGVGPATHGRFHHAHLVPGTYRAQDLSREATAWPPFWKAFADAGLRVAAVDVPKSPVAKVIDGVEIVDWMPHGKDHARPIVYPAGHEIASSLVSDADFRCNRLVIGLEDGLAHAEAVKVRGERRNRVLQGLLKEDWDFFVAVLAETHCIGHHCWHFHDRSHPRFDVEGVEAGGDVVAAEYETADRFLGECVAAAGPDATVVVFSLLGMGPNHSAAYLLDDVLRKVEGGTPARERQGAVDKLKPFVPAAFKRLADQVLPPALSAAFHANAHRKAFIVPHDAVSSAIRLNVRGREPNGSIEPGSEYESWCQRIADALLALRNVEDGRPVVQSVVKTAEEYSGPHQDDFADLLVVWESTAPVNGVWSEELGEFRGSVVVRSGNHTPGGWFTMSGPGIARGELATGATIADLGPTAARLLGVALPLSEGSAIEPAAAYS